MVEGRLSRAFIDFPHTRVVEAWLTPWLHGASETGEEEEEREEERGKEWGGQNQADM